MLRSHLLTRSTSSTEKVQERAACRGRVRHSQIFEEVVSNTQLRYDEKPWASAKHPKLKWERGIFYGSVVIGVAIGAILCYLAYASVTNHEASLPAVCVVTLASYTRLSIALFWTTIFTTSTKAHGVMRYREVVSEVAASNGLPKIPRMPTPMRRVFTSSQP
jgi:hypothetical protein